MLQSAVFGKAKCKLCGDKVRFVLKHLNDKHAEILESELKKIKMQQIVKKYFEE